MADDLPASRGNQRNLFAARYAQRVDQVCLARLPESLLVNHANCGKVGGGFGAYTDMETHRDNAFSKNRSIPRACSSRALSRDYCGVFPYDCNEGCTELICTPDQAAVRSVRNVLSNNEEVYT